MKYDFRKRSDDAKIYNDQPSMTKQDFKDQCDLNNILRKYSKNGVNPFVLTADAKFGDFSNVPSYDEAINLVESASQHFDQLPAKLRERFMYDPGQLLNFLSDPSNRAEAVDLGLVLPQSPIQPIVESGASKSSTGDSDLKS